MGWPWKKIAVGVKKAIGLGAVLGVPGLAAVDALIDNIEDALPDAPGEKKLATVEAVSDAILGSELVNLPADTQERIKILRREYINLGVTVRNAAARSMDVAEELAALLKG